MPVRIRSARAEERVEAPVLWQGCPLRRGVTLGGRVGGAALAAAGVAAMVAGAGGALELVGAAAATAGVVALAASFRCRRLEVALGRERLRVELGPFRRTLAVGLLGSPEVAGSSGWRRWFAGHEVRVEVLASGEVLRIPSREPEELAAALRVASGERTADVGGGRGRPPDDRPDGR